jgi:hypothetical protein
MNTRLSRPALLQPGIPFVGPRRRSWLFAVLLAALLAALLAWPSRHSTALNDLRLVGPRGPVCLRIVIADDISGSMTKFASARNAAVEEMRRWAGHNLRPDDQIGVLQFAVNAGWQSGPGSATPSPHASVVHDGINTNLNPVLQLVQALPASSCDTALVLVSDAQLADLPADPVAGRRALEAGHVHDLFLLAPGQSIDVPPAWTTAFPEAEPRRFNGNDAAATGLTFGDVVATLTRQQLRHV